MTTSHEGRQCLSINPQIFFFTPFILSGKSSWASKISLAQHIRFEKEPDRRYQHVSEVKTEVETIATGKAEPAAVSNEGAKSSKISKWLNAESVETHVNTIAYIKIAFGVLFVLIGIGLCILLISLSGVVKSEGDMEAAKILPMVGSGLLVLFMILSVPDLIGGIGLLKRKGWARILIIILSILGSLLFIPIGAAVAIYSLWVLMNKETVELFAKNRQAKNVKPA